MNYMIIWGVVCGMPETTYDYMNRIAREGDRQVRRRSGRKAGRATRRSVERSNRPKRVRSD